MIEILSEGIGNVRLGAVTAYGKWENDGELTVITLETQSLTIDNRKELERYRNCSTPVQMRLPCDRCAKTGIVMGFERDERSAKFYLSRNGNKSAD